ncbi:MAG: DUF2461 domain-containing protein [Armatimonadetes bacterium]|nr:DUF2461 domain-containing protein [Armatimonadota bacterium]MBS1725253.1 DUF2461 domain-containing protein [Armatimonadota bacterium]
MSFPESGRRFLRELELNNNRDWFNAHKAEYETEVKGPSEEFFEDVQQGLADLRGEEFGGKLYRIYRDVRFSKDKTPYTPYVRMSFWRMPEESGLCRAFHASIEPDRLTVGTGVWEFDSERLAAFRQSVDELPAVLDALVEMGARIPEPELARVPKGFDAALPLADHYRRKGISAWFDHELDREAIEASLALDGMRKLTPLYDWLCKF